MKNFLCKLMLSSKFMKHRMLEWLIENEYLTQCSKYIISKLPLKKKYNIEHELLSRSEFLFKKNDKLGIYMNETIKNKEYLFKYYI